MTRRNETSPQGGSKKFDQQGAYYKARNKESTGQGNKHMRTFAYSKKTERMTSYADVNYITLLLKTVKSTACAKFALACKEAYIRGMKTGNMKEIVADQETGFVNSCDYWFELLAELSVQTTMKKLMSNPPRSDTVTDLGDGETSNTNVALFEDATFADILMMLKDKEIPEVVVKVWKSFNFYYKMSEGWIKGETAIPDSYLLWYTPLAAASTIKDLVKSAIAEQGESRLHCQKFGIKTVKFSDAFLDAEERMLKTKDLSDESISFFNFNPLCYRALAADKMIYPLYPFHADTSETKKWWSTTGDPNNAKMNYLAKLLHEYNATYNQWGGAMSGPLYTTTQDDWCIRAKYTESAEFLADEIVTYIEVFMKFAAAWQQTNTVNIELTGTDVSNYDINLANSGLTWPLATELDLKSGSGIDETASDETLISYLIELMY